jgi:hypothetical protein
METFDEKIEKQPDDPHTPTMLDKTAESQETVMLEHSDGKHSYDLEKHDAVYKSMASNYRRETKQIESIPQI